MSKRGPVATQKAENLPEKTTPRIDHRQLSRHLRWFRELRNKSLANVETRHKEVLRGLADTPRTRLHNIVREGVTAIEAAGVVPLELSLEDLDVISLVYDIDRLFLEPLLSTPSAVQCLVQRFGSEEHWQEIDRPANVAEQGEKGCTYQVQRVRLRHTEEVALVFLTIEGGGHSKSHEHPGDELMYVLKGTIEARLEHCGLAVSLKEGQYAHFYAEQRHSAWNLGDSNAEVLIIRFYPRGSRYHLIRALKKKKSYSGALLARVIDEVTESVDLEAAKKVPPDEIGPKSPVLDKHGLGRLLQSACSEDFRGPGDGLSLNDLEKRATSQKLDYDRSRIDRWHQGTSALTLNDLPSLAELYELERMLFFHFLFPAYRSAIAVRDKEEWYQVPEHFVGSPKVIYHVPKRRLADSDIAIALLKFEVGASTRVNRHPGHELLLPRKGRLGVVFGEHDPRANPTVLEAPDDFAHYDSSLKHYVVNAGDEPAEAMVIRFYQ